MPQIYSLTTKARRLHAPKNGHILHIIRGNERYPYYVATPHITYKEVALAAAESGRAKDLEALLKQGLVPQDIKDRLGWTPYHFGARQGNIAMLNVIYQAWPEGIDEAGAGNWTPMHEAASKGQQSAMRFLSLLGADLTRRTPYGNETPEDVACRRGYEKIFYKTIRQKKKA